MDDACGEVHLLDRDLTTLCGSPFGWLTASIERCTCLACLSLLDHTRDATGDDAPTMVRRGTTGH